MWARLTAMSVLGLAVASLGQQPVPGDVPAGGPQVFIAERTFDMGRIREGEDGVGVFHIENRGNEDLLIEEITTSCGCTVAELPDEERRIRPRETRDLTITFHSQGRLGQQRSVVVLKLNDPREPRVNLVVKSVVETLFRVVPDPPLILRSARRGSTLPPLEVYPTREDEGLDQLEVDVPPGLLQYDQAPVVDDDGVAGVRLTFRVPDEIELGIVNGRIKLAAVVNGESATLTVPVTGQVVGDLTVRPAIIQSLEATPRGRRFAPLTIAATNDKPFRVLGIDAGPYLDVQCESRKRDTEWSVRTILRDDAPDGPLAATITIRTDNDGQPVLNVPAFVNVRPRCLIEPALALFGPARKNSIRVRVQNGEPNTFRLGKITSTDPRIVARQDDAASLLGHVAFVRVELAAGAATPEAFQADVVVETDIAGAPEIRIPVEYAP